MTASQPTSGHPGSGTSTPLSADPCELCGESTAPGSGRWVNRLGYDDGWACAECMALDCERCGKPITLDEDVRVRVGGCELVIHDECRQVGDEEA